MNVKNSFWGEENQGHSRRGKGVEEVQKETFFENCSKKKGILKSENKLSVLGL